LTNTKARKRTTTSSGPNSLAGKKTNQRGDTETTTKSIVAAGSLPSAESYLLQASQVDPIDSAKSEKTEVLVDQYSTLSGNSYQIGGAASSAGGAKKKSESKIVDPSSYTTPVPTLATLSYQEKPISTKKLEVITETLIDVSFPELKSSNIDNVSNKGVVSSLTQIVDPNQSATAIGGVIREFTAIDKWHSELKQTDYSNLIGVTWTEYGTESYSPPARLFVNNSVWTNGISNILQYQRPQPKTVTSTIVYTIEASESQDFCYNPLTQTLVTDFGTFTNVLHNVVQYLAGGTPVSAIPSVPSSSYLPNEITYRYSSTRISGMGGLYLKKVVKIPFASLYF
jgi:hypothetical protein